MAKLEIHDTPANLITANQEIEIEGEGGRRFTLKRPPQIVLNWHISSLVSNFYHIQMAADALWVSKIDGETLPLPQTEGQLKERVQRVLGESGEGLLYVQIAREEFFGEGKETLEDKRERIKKKLLPTESGSASG